MYISFYYRKQLNKHWILVCDISHKSNICFTLISHKQAYEDKCVILSKDFALSYTLL